MQIISCLTLIVVSVERPQGGGWPIHRMDVHSKSVLRFVALGESALLCSLLSLFLSSLPHWCFYLVLLSYALWLCPAHSPHFFLSPVPAAVTKLGAIFCVSGWPFTAAAELISLVMCFLHPLHYS